MIYAKVKYGSQIRFLSKMSHILKLGRHAHLGFRMGYKKYSSSYYKLNKKLTEENILDRNGQFVETITNNWMAEIPLYAKPDELRALGSRHTFNLYLSLIIMGNLTLNQMIRGLDSSQRSVYAGVKRLEDLSMIRIKKSSVQFDEKNPVFDWLVRYLKFALVQADADDDPGPLFDCVPGYIDGPQAYLLTHYKPGRTTSPAQMILRTSPLFEQFWRYALQHIRYFADYPKNIVILPPADDAFIVWLNGIPYNKNSAGVS